ncbi:MAG: ferrous iron transport protein A [Ardenticatenaceae bacterium]|nr:ferrous iron transport protein A [Ardenticatenaceae bacterium]
MTIPLTQLQPGKIAQVVAITSSDESRLLKLSAYGLIPGSIIKLQQRFPAYVLRIGETLLSLDDDVAQEIHLSRVME